MSMLGKIMLVVNLLAAAGLFYFATQDWAKRQETNGTVLRYRLTIDGMPVDPAATSGESDPDAIHISVTTPAGHTTETVTKKLLDAHFKDAASGTYGGSGAVASQIAEVKTVQDKITTELDTKPNEQAKVAFLCGSVDDKLTFVPGLLMKLAESFEERAAIRKLAFGTAAQMPANREKATARFKRKFEAVLKAPDPKSLDAEATRVKELKEKILAAPDDAAAKAELAAISAEGSPAYTRDDSDRRRRIAKLLMLVDPLAGWQKRVAIVVGLQQYLTAIIDQTGRLEEMTRRAERSFEIDQNAFDEDYELLKRLALARDQRVLQQERVNSGYTAQLTADIDIEAKRMVQLNAMKDEIAALTSEINADLKLQAEVEKALFEVQKKVGDTLRGNLNLEKDLGNAEGK